MLTFNSFEEDLGRGERNLKVLKLLCVLWRKVSRKSVHGTAPDVHGLSLHRPW